MNVKRKQDWKPVELRKATLGLLHEEGVVSGYWGACSIDPQWLIDRGFPAGFVLPMVEDFRYEPGNPHTAIIRYANDGSAYFVSHLRGVSILRVLAALAKILGADTTDADREWGRKASARLLAASIKKAITKEERINQ